MAPGGQVGVDRELAGAQPQFLEARDLGVRKRLVDEVGQRLAPEQRERLARRVVRGAVRSRRLGHEPAQPVDVDQFAVDPQLVRTPLGEDLRATVGTECRAQPPDVVLDHLRGARRRRLAPQSLDQPVGRDGPVRLQPEHRQDRALLRSAQLERKVAEARLNRSEEPNLHEAGSHALIVQRPGLLVV